MVTGAVLDMSPPPPHADFPLCKTRITILTSSVVCGETIDAVTATLRASVKLKPFPYLVHILKSENLFPFLK